MTPSRPQGQKPSKAQAFFHAHRRAVTAAVVGMALVLLFVAGGMATILLRTEPPTGEVVMSPSAEAPSASAVASPTESPATSPSSAASAEPSTVPATPTYDTSDPFAAIVLVNDLRVREEPATGAVIGALDAGDTVAIGTDESVDGMTWYSVTADGDLRGWVAAGPDEDPWLDLHYRVAQRMPPRVEGIAGGDGFVAWGVVERVGRSSKGDRWVAASADGREWQLGSIPDVASDADAVLVAHGPAGWLMVTSVIRFDENRDYTTSVEAWRSQDGLTWQPGSVRVVDYLDRPWFIEPTFRPFRLTGSASGYILEGSVDTGEEKNVLSSADLVSWTREDSPGTFDEPMALGDGFLVWHEGNDVADTTYTDLVNLIDVAEPVEAGVWASWAGAARAGEQLVTTRVVEEPSRHREMWVARIPNWATANPSLDWVSSPSSVAAFDGFTVAEMLTVGDEAVALGNSHGTGELGIWRTTDGTAWDVIASSALNGYAVAGVVASDADELVIVVSEATPAGPNPRFARWAAADGWSIEADPVLGSTVTAVVGACPDLPDTAFEWAAISATVATECFGDQAISFEAWLPLVGQDGCGAGAFGSDCSPWILEPRWLTDSIEIGIVEANWPAGYAARSPAATGDGVRGSWVVLTGHWADPEASACRSRPAEMWPVHSLGNPNPPCVGFVVTDISSAP